MTNRKTAIRYIALVGLIIASGLAGAISYGIMAAGVLTATISVVAAPFIAPVVGGVAVASLIASVGVHIGAAIVYVGSQWPSDTPAKVAAAHASPAAAPIKVNLAPMTTAQQGAFNSRKTAAATAKNTTPTPAIPATGQDAAATACQGKLAASFAWVQSQGRHPSYVVLPDDGSGTRSCQITCNDGYAGGACGLTYNASYPLTSNATYTKAVAAVICPTGSHQNGTSCQLDQDPNAAAVVNPDGKTPQFDPAGIPGDATLSPDGSTLTRTISNADGTQTRTDAVLQPDGSMNLVDSTFDPATGKTEHVGAAIDTNGVVRGIAGAESTGNYAQAPGGSGVTFPSGGSSGSQNGTGTGGSCGGTGQPACAVDFGAAGTGPDLFVLDTTEMDTAMKVGDDNFKPLLSFQMPAHSSACPTMDVPLDYFRKTGVASTSQSCDFMEKNRAAMSSVFTLMWVIAALFIVLSA